MSVPPPETSHKPPEKLHLWKPHIGSSPVAWRLRTQHCPCWGMGSILGPGTFMCHGRSRKRKRVPNWQEPGCPPGGMERKREFSIHKMERKFVSEWTGPTPSTGWEPPSSWEGCAQRGNLRSVWGTLVTRRNLELNLELSSVMPKEIRTIAFIFLC